jgi:hypothetical protein
VPSQKPQSPCNTRSSFKSVSERGQPIRGLEEAAKLPDVKVFHAGTAVRDEPIL